MSLVNATTTSRLLRLVESGALDAGSLVTHRMHLKKRSKMRYCRLIWLQDFSYLEASEAYETFQAASRHQALKVAIDF